MRRSFWFFLVLPTFVLIPLSFSFGALPHLSAAGLFAAMVRELFCTIPLGSRRHGRSVRIGLCSAACAAALGTLAALGLSRGRGGWPATCCFTLMLSPLLMPNIIYALGIYQVYSSLGLIGTEVGLALAHSVLGMP